MVRAWVKEKMLPALLAAMLLAGLASPAKAIAPDIVIRMGQTIVYTVPEGVERVAIGDGEVLGVQPLGGQSKDLLISAKKPGFTNFLVWPMPYRGADGRMIQGAVRNYNIEVLTYRRPEMVAVRVKVLEVSRTESGKTGVDWSDAVSWSEAPPNSPFRFGLPMRSSLLEAQLNMMVQNRRAKLLAQPTLLTMSGQSAKFLSGGEIPIPLILQNSSSIEWKPFGVKLDVEPRVEGADTMVLKVRPEVSRIDQTNAIKLPTISVPAVATRWTETFMQLKSGESIVVSGLLSDEDEETVTGVPILSSIPFLGEAFKFRESRKNHTELVFLLTPTIVNNPATMPENEYGKR